MATAEEVLEFWFGVPAKTEAELMGKVRRWFSGGPALDAELCERFEPDVQLALQGKLEAWQLDARGTLALVLLFDQFTRNIYRGTARAYDGDAKALELVTRAFDTGLERQLDWEAKCFLVMPFLHAESAAAQKRAVELMSALLTQAPPVNQKLFAAGLEQARKYQDVVARFGRFPHRNAALGRNSTSDELAFLATWEQAAPPATLSRELQQG